MCKLCSDCETKLSAVIRTMKETGFDKEFFTSDNKVGYTIACNEMLNYLIGPVECLPVKANNPEEVFGLCDRPECPICGGKDELGYET